MWKSCERVRSTVCGVRWGVLTPLDSDLTDAQDLFCFANMFSVSGEGVSCTHSTHQNVGELVDAEGSQRGGKVVMCAH